MTLSLSLTKRLRDFLSNVTISFNFQNQNKPQKLLTDFVKFEKSKKKGTRSRKLSKKLKNMYIELGCKRDDRTSGVI